MYKSWHEWEPDGSDQQSVLKEVARHMQNAWEHRDKPGSTRFKAGHQLAHKGWKFGSGVVDLADGSAVAGIKALRALIIAGRHDWFQRAAEVAPGESVTALDAPTTTERTYLANLCGPGTRLSRIRLDDADIWMLPERAGWRIAAVFVRDFSASGLKQVMQLATATHGGCLLAVPMIWAIVVVATVSRRD